VGRATSSLLVLKWKVRAVLQASTREPSSGKTATLDIHRNQRTRKGEGGENSRDAPAYTRAAVG